MGPLRLASSAPPPSKEPREESEGISPLVPLGEMGRGTRARGGAENGHKQMSLSLFRVVIPHTYDVLPADASAILTGPRSFPKSRIMRRQRNSLQALRFLGSSGWSLSRYPPRSKTRVSLTQGGRTDVVNSWIEAERTTSTPTDPAHFRRAILVSEIYPATHLRRGPLSTLQQVPVRR